LKHTGCLFKGSVFSIVGTESFGIVYTGLEAKQL